MSNQKSIYEELKPFAGMIIDQGRGVTVSDLAFASAEDRYSTAFIQLSTLTLPASTTVKLFQNNIGETGQGSGSYVLTRAETNNTNGDRQPSNQVYIATHLGFQVYAITLGLEVIPITNPNSLYSICNSTVWNLTVGDGIKRTLGSVLEYPAGSGVDTTLSSGVGSSVAVVAAPSVAFSNNGWIGCAKRKLPIPIVFPPNVQVDIELETGGAQILIDNNNAISGVWATTFTTGKIAYKATFTGFRMTLPA